MSPNLFILTGSHNYKNDDDSPRKVDPKDVSFSEKTEDPSRF